MGKKKKNKNPFMVFHKKINNVDSETVVSKNPEDKSGDINNVSDNQTISLELIQQKIPQHVVAPLENAKQQDGKLLCSKCDESLHKVENMIIITDGKNGIFGLNSYYCSNCDMIYVNEEDVLEIDEFLPNNSIEKIKIDVLSNFKHYIEKAANIESLHNEAILRNMLDKINEVKEDTAFKIVKGKTLPSVCPICDRVFAFQKDLLLLYRDDDTEEYYLKGCYCKNCGLIYIEDNQLLEYMEAGLSTVNLLEVFINREPDEDDAAASLLEKELASGKTLYIHRGNIVCEKKHHDVISVTAEVPVGNSDEIVQININYCKDCHKCFINDTVYEQYRDKGILPAIRLARVKSDGTYPSEYETELAPEGPLHLLGYNVTQKDDYSDAYRQRLLGNIMDYGALSKHKVENYLSTFIKKGLGQKNKAIAVSKWKKDLEFVEHYKINRQAKVKITAVKPYK